MRFDWSQFAYMLALGFMLAAMWVGIALMARFAWQLYHGLCI